MPSKKKPTDATEPATPREPKRITIELSAEVSIECAEIAHDTGLPVDAVRGIVRDHVARVLAEHAMEPRAIVLAHQTAALRPKG